MILQKTIPHNPLAPRKLPGIQPMDMNDLLVADEAFDGQMAERDRLLSEVRDDVIVLDDTAMEAAQELLEMVLKTRYDGSGESVQRQDGVEVPIDWSKPLDTLGRLVQEDFCILQKAESEAEHVLTGAVLCFPASWTLKEKFMQPLIGIHVPVESYDDSIAARVQRLFDGVQVDRPLWRFNALWYQDATLHHPRSQDDPRDRDHGDQAPYLRSERQMIFRLPKSRAVVFAIHTYVLTREGVLAQWQE